MKHFIAFLCLFLLNISVSHALVTINNVSYTANSVTFTIDGDLTGYGALPTFSDYFSLVYGGDIWNGVSSSDSNTWSRSVFDNKVLDQNGLTGTFPSSNSTWSQYTTSLVDATVSNATVTVSFSQPRLNVLAASPSISFRWGPPSSSTILATVTPTPPTPATATPATPVPTISVWGLGILAGLLGLMGFVRRRKT